MATPAKTTVKKTAKAATQPTKKSVAPAKAPAKKVAKTAPAKSVAAKAPAKAAVAVKAKASATKPAVRGKARVSDEQRRHYVEVAAYYIAEGHGFTPGRELADWTAAEAKIDRLLAEGLLNP